ncbi:hypothetical protein K9L16_00720 [Candidatus Pacearchaeota archaeon]|nr:hypothetical protein [Candidatus Pacearchaeota archaeon]
MKKILIISALVVLFAVLFFLLFKISSTGFVIGNLEDTYVVTKAICNETNFCQDYTAECQDNKIQKITLLTGNSIQHNKNWTDPRKTNKTITKENICERN